MKVPRKGRSHGSGRRAVASLLVPALVSGLTLAYGVSAQAAPAAPPPEQPAGAARQTYSAGTYLIQLSGDPVAAQPETAPEPGKRLNTRSEAVRDHVRRLERARDQVLAEVPGVRPLYSYQYVLNGFAAELTASQATKLARAPGVASLVRNEMIRPTGTDEAVGAGSGGATAARAAVSGPGRAYGATGVLPAADTAKFLGLKERGGLYSKFRGGQRNAGAGVIIGVVDFGIDNTNPSLRALPEPRPDAEAIARKWKGVCDPGEDRAHPYTCNNKLIGARYFNKSVPELAEDDTPSPVDDEGHGTHTSTTAAGNYGVPASVPGTGISRTRISGIAPAARVAAYKACWKGSGCWTADVAAAIDQAVADGVDVINISLGTGGDPADLTRPTYTAMFNAAKAGVFVSGSAGNDGPSRVVNNAPWISTAAASTHDLGYRTRVVLGDGTSYTGTGLNASPVPSARFVDAAGAARSGVDAAQAALCRPGTLDPAKVKGAIVLCETNGDGTGARAGKSAQVEAAGGVGMVLYNSRALLDTRGDVHSVPAVHVDNVTGRAVKAYLDRAGDRATARLGAARAVRQEAPAIAAFSSGGPDVANGGDLLKPDIAAPGVDVVAGAVPGGNGGTFRGPQGIASGTSMAAPHITGLAALLRSLHPDWSPMEVKSALMTTAATKTDEGKEIRRIGADGPATPLDYGAGQVAPNAADDPGLVYDATSADWTAYLCALGQRPVTGDGGDACATARKIDPSDLNYPTISIGDLAGKQTVTRTVTNVGDTTGVYTATLRTPRGYRATVSPKRLIVPPGRSATYRVTFTRTDADYGKWAFGSVSWGDRDGHRVRSAIALRATQIAVPSQADGTGATGSLTLQAKTGWDGNLTTTLNGLYSGTVRTGTLTGTWTDSFTPPPSPLPASAARTEITVPEGTALARVAIRSSDFLAGSDIDLWVYDKDGNRISSPTGSSDEYLDLTEPGTYEVYVNQFALPEGATSQTYTLHTWLIGPDSRPDRPATVTPAEQRVALGGTADVTVSWRDLPTGRTYLGLVGYDDGTGTVGTTLLTVTP
ncbi:S8 family serine peptidase [Streptomyces gossypiisoli]|uniref:S8 family serine peptidase n=1 Tax=Streptomyces gossypiisoli TaxID=2748864 RepID=UPI0015DAA75B|nr:S8 family serine peptidase [Streptomyces gossypiisoli]